MTSSTMLPRPGPGPHPSSGEARYSGGMPRLLPAGDPGPADLQAHLARFGPPPLDHPGQALVAELQAAGLTGRGGAAFPTHRKLAAMAGGRRPAVVIGNGAEGEPASRKDKTLLWAAPHLVLDGLQLAAGTVGSATAGLYVPRDRRLHQWLSAAIADRAAAGLDLVPVELIGAPPRFLAGEESALASRAAGGPALPTFRPSRTPPRVAGHPALVQNVETLAHLALIARYGAAWFRSAGTAGEPGSMLATLHQADGRVEVAETELGTPIADLLARPTQAVLVGGYHGAWIPGGLAERLPLANAALRPLGAAVGAGVLAALPPGRCGLAETARVARYLALESAGQCGPCFNGLPRIAGALAELAGPRPSPGTVAAIGRWCGLADGRGACRHPDGTVRFVRSALGVFAPELDHHLRGQCTATSRHPFLPLPPDPAPDDADWR
ncbi:MAG TPA: NADH-ubiquinone oxidoreductase-F iron-sulfur binding region domain-containing protein [Streptosporangiaceae bacterium]